jgi:hypothetical protein
MPTPTRTDPKKAALRVAGLTLINALVFQEQLSRTNRRVQTLARLRSRSPLRTALIDHWDFIIREIDYVPIFELGVKLLQALPSAPHVEQALQQALRTAEKVLARQAALRHDLMGRVYHRLLAEAKYLGTYYTSVPAATLLLKLALAPEAWPQVNWESPEDVARLRIADLACGTGTLLMAAIQAIIDNHVLKSADKGLSPQLSDLHRKLVEQVVWGYDVLLSAVHLTASTIALLSPEVVFQHMCLYLLPLGGPQGRLGSIEFLEAPCVTVGGYLFGPVPEAVHVAPKGSVVRSVCLPDGGCDVVTMNPPFTRSVGGNLLFGSRPASERKAMQRKLSKLLRTCRAKANTTAGLGSVFVAVADRPWTLKPGGRLALVLPKTVLTGVAWADTRQLLAESYTLEYVVVSHEPGRWNFSENTNLSEVLLVARKKSATDDDAGAETCWINLSRNPRNVTEALAIAHSLKATRPASFLGAAVTHLKTNGQEWGEIFRVPWRELRSGPWFLGAFARTDLNRIAFDLIRRHRMLSKPVPVTVLRDILELGPDCRDVHDGFTRSKSPTRYPAFWDHDSAKVRTMDFTPNAYLAPRETAAHGRPFRDPELLWGRSGRVLIAERLWLKTARVVAGRTTRPVLGNVWWPCSPKGKTGVAEEKAIALWLNSTPGLILLLAHRTETRGAWVKFKKPSLEEMPVLNVAELPKSCVGQLAEAFDSLKDRELRPLPEMDRDQVRAEIDRTVAKALKLPQLDEVRELLAREPVICLTA